MEAVRLVSSEDLATFHVYGALIVDVISIVNHDWVVSIRHVYHEANSCANCLALNGVLQHESFVEFRYPSAELRPLLLV